MSLAPAPLAGWTPVRLSWTGDRPVIRWCFTDGVGFNDPFFEQTIERCLADPFRLLFWRETEIDSTDVAAAGPTLEPAGLIFHMSRCGSTLVSQMLAALPHVVVMSEPDPVDAVLRALRSRPGVSEAQAVDWLRTMVSVLGQRRRPEHTRYVVKLGASAILHLPLFRAAFPNAKCVFLYRDPVDVMVSQLDQTGPELLPGMLPPDRLGLSASELQSLSAAQYGAAVLTAFCESAYDGARHHHVTPIEYRSLPEALTSIVAPLFDIRLGPGDSGVLAAVQARNAKYPAVKFVADDETKRRRSTPAIEAAVNDRLLPAYEKLERVRQRPGF